MRERNNFPDFDLNEYFRRFSILGLAPKLSSWLNPIINHKSELGVNKREEKESETSSSFDQKKKPL